MSDILKIIFENQELIRRLFVVAVSILNIVIENAPSNRYTQCTVQVGLKSL